MWFSRHGGVGLTVGLDDRRGLFQAMILRWPGCRTWVGKMSMMTLRPLTLKVRGTRGCCVGHPACLQASALCWWLLFTKSRPVALGAVWQMWCVWAEELPSRCLGGRWFWQRYVPSFQNPFCLDGGLNLPAPWSSAWDGWAWASKASERGIYSVGCGCICRPTKSIGRWSPTAAPEPGVWLRLCCAPPSPFRSRQHQEVGRAVPKIDDCKWKVIQALLKSVCRLVTLRFVII